MDIEFYKKSLGTLDFKSVNEATEWFAMVFGTFDNYIEQSMKTKKTYRDALGNHLHTQECVDYSVRTAMNGSGYHCIADCANSLREALAEGGECA